MQGSIVPATNVPLEGKTPNIKNKNRTFCTSVPSSSSSSGATASPLFEIFQSSQLLLPI